MTSEQEAGNKDIGVNDDLFHLDRAQLTAHNPQKARAF